MHHAAPASSQQSLEKRENADVLWPEFWNISSHMIPLSLLHLCNCQGGTRVRVCVCAHMYQYVHVSEEEERDMSERDYFVIGLYLYTSNYI